MLNAILFLLGGILIGRLFRNKIKKFSYLSLIQTIVIIAMLFALGLSVGANKTVMENLTSLGLQALLLSSLCIIGSILTGWLFWKITYSQKKK